MLSQTLSLATGPHSKGVRWRAFNIHARTLPQSPGLQVTLSVARYL